MIDPPMGDYPKLVRDNIPDIIRKDGLKVEMAVYEGDEFEHFLDNKLKEEVDEFIKAHSEEELADILEVIDAISAHYRFDRGKVKRIKAKKAIERGRFSKRIIVKKVNQ